MQPVIAAVVVVLLCTDILLLLVSVAYIGPCNLDRLMKLSELICRLYQVIDIILHLGTVLLVPPSFLSNRF